MITKNKSKIFLTLFLLIVMASTIASASATIGSLAVSHDSKVTVGKNITIEATLTLNDDTDLSGFDVYFAVGENGTSNKTDSNGKAYYTYTADTVGVKNVVVYLVPINLVIDDSATKISISANRYDGKLTVVSENGGSTNPGDTTNPGGSTNSGDSTNPGGSTNSDSTDSGSTNPNFFPIFWPMTYVGNTSASGALDSHKTVTSKLLPDLIITKVKKSAANTFKITIKNQGKVASSKAILQVFCGCKKFVKNYNVKSLAAGKSVTITVKFSSKVKSHIKFAKVIYNKKLKESNYKNNFFRIGKI